MSYPKKEGNQMIDLLHLLVHKQIITKQEVTNLFSNGKRSITSEMRSESMYIWNGL